MDCADVNKLLSTYHDGELQTGEREQLAAHVHDCVRCSEDLANFRRLSAVVQGLPSEVPAELAWEHFHGKLVAISTVTGTGADRRSTITLRKPRWLAYPALRPLIYAAAVVLLVAGWFAFDANFAPGVQEALAADIERYAEQFQQNPEEAQSALIAKYHGQPVDLNEAMHRVSYEPAVAEGLPESYRVVSMHLLQMPCCDCLQTICQRSDGSKFAIFEYGEGQPSSDKSRASGMSPCHGEHCCLGELRENFAMSWKKADRHVSVVGMRDPAEIETFASWLN